MNEKWLRLMARDQNVYNVGRPRPGSVFVPDVQNYNSLSILHCLRTQPLIMRFIAVVAVLFAGLAAAQPVEDGDSLVWTINTLHSRYTVLTKLVLRLPELASTVRPLHARIACPCDHV